MYIELKWIIPETYHLAIHKFLSIQ